MIEWKVTSLGLAGIWSRASRIFDSGSSVSMLDGRRRKRRSKVLGLSLINWASRLPIWSGSAIRLALEPPDEPAAQVRAAVRRRQEDDPADVGLVLEEQVVTELGEDRGGAKHVLEPAVGVDLPEPIAAIDGHHVAQESPHAMPEQDHPRGLRVAAGGVVGPLELLERVAQAAPRRSARARRSGT